MSSKYLPEPWWGNDGSKPLHSVVINFNPSAGGECQLRGENLYRDDYANDVVNNEAIPEGEKKPYLYQTRDWHKNKRAMPILNSLNRLYGIDAPDGWRNHLSIELIPWHTKGVDEQYMKYLKQNIQAVYDQSICFAAHESRRIENEKLNRVVILRASGNKTKQLLEYLGSISKSYEVGEINETENKQGKYMEFSIHEISDVRFVSIWGPLSRNDFPRSVLDEILRVILK